jgi:hypothetical protein
MVTPKKQGEREGYRASGVRSVFTGLDPTAYGL